MVKGGRQKKQRVAFPRVRLGKIDRSEDRCDQAGIGSLKAPIRVDVRMHVARDQCRRIVSSRGLREESRDRRGARAELDDPAIFSLPRFVLHLARSPIVVPSERPRISAFEDFAQRPAQARGNSGNVHEFEEMPEARGTSFQGVPRREAGRSPMLPLANYAVNRCATFPPPRAPAAAPANSRRPPAPRRAPKPTSTDSPRTTWTARARSPASRRW